MKQAYEVAIGRVTLEPGSTQEPIKDSMQIQMIKPLLIGNHNYAKGDILDYEVTGDKKKELVELGLASWFTPKPKPPVEETASLKVPSTATKHKGKAN